MLKLNSVGFKISLKLTFQDWLFEERTPWSCELGSICSKLAVNHGPSFKVANCEHAMTGSIVAI